ncbi:hypothetical protein ElyMa_004782900 [Elysia marginata]|uniref:Uncharacterized protein n=1 Tax=Elysia marginata TaxID=1093978 RepID=A0AAV4IGJ9_9GAST|nr:hypothetical protein ElyMa_004782900 [Elysia marginata]
MKDREKIEIAGARSFKATSILHKTSIPMDPSETKKKRTTELDFVNGGGQGPQRKRSFLRNSSPALNWPKWRNLAIASNVRWL